MSKTKSELLFEELLEERGFEFKRGEEYFEKGRGKTCPDYYVETKYGNIICEVKEYDESEAHKIFQKVKLMAFLPERILNPIKNKIYSASQQLKPYARNKFPMIVILANPNNYFADLSNEEISSFLPNRKKHISAVCVLEYSTIISKKIAEIEKEIEEKYKDEKKTFDVVDKMAKELYGEVESLKKRELLIEARKALRLKVFHNTKANIKLPKETFNSKYDEHY